MARAASRNSQNLQGSPAEGGTARYRQIRDWLRDEIVGGALPLESRVPPEVEIMRLHGVSRGTVRRAMLDLELAGYIRRRPGAGTFVARDRPLHRRTRRWAFVRRHPHHGGDAALDGLEAYARLTGADLVVEDVSDSPERFAQAVTRPGEPRVEGFVIEPLVYQRNGQRFYRPLLEAQVPFVLLRVPVAGVPAPLVVFDHQTIGRQATRHLLDLGHRRIGYVGSPRYWVIDQEVLGYEAALREAQVEPRKEWLSFEDRVSPERGFEATRRLLALDEPPTAMLALNDETAANAYRAIKAAGLRVPRDVSVVACSGIGVHLPAAIDPPLTVWAPWHAGRRLGQTAGEVLEALIDHRTPREARTILVDPAPLPRGSVDRAPAGREDGR